MDREPGYYSVGGGPIRTAVLHRLMRSVLDFRPILVNPYTAYFLPQPLITMFMKAAYTRKLSRWMSEHRVGHLFDDRYELYRAVRDSEKLDGPIHYLEFGVHKGWSLNWWVTGIKDRQARFTGFDTFTGLPEDWGIWQKGSMSTGAKLPDLQDSRCNFEVGLFQETLAPFLKNEPLDYRRLVIHLDADLYSSTLYVLTTIAHHLKRGDLLIFDELSSMRCPEQEFRAFVDFVSAFRVGYRVLGATRIYKQVAIEITEPVGRAGNR